MPLSTNPWDVTVGGVTGPLIFAKGTGALSGTIFGDNFVGFFDEASQTLTMLRNPQLISSSGFSGKLASPLTVFKGDFFQFTAPGAAAPTSVLAGVVSTVSGSGALVDTSWYAQNPPATKTGKEHKDGKDGKEHKDAKEGKEHPPEKLPELHFSNVPMPSMHAAEPGVATGRSFIQSHERPPVGEMALGDTNNRETS